MKSKTIPLICYTCGGQFGKAAFSGIGNLEVITKLRWLQHSSNGPFDEPYDIKFFCCEDCAKQLKQEGMVNV